MKVQEVFDRVYRVLQDDSMIRWLPTETLQWITDGQRVIVLVRPDSCMKNTTLDLVEGSRQTIPDDGLRLLDIVRNIGGRSVRLVDREILDASDPAWHTRKGSPVIRNYAYDNRDPKTFYVSPPAMKPDPKLIPPKATLEIMYSVLPVPVTDAADDLTVSDIYMDPLVNYVLFRSYTKEAQFAQNAQLAATYLQTFMSMLGVKTKKDAAFSPDLNSKGAMPNPWVTTESV